MATYAVGDIQGCARTLFELLRRIAFDPARDHVLLVGDLVNRGDDSLTALRWAYAHRACITLVLGNHDLALLATAAGVRGRRPLDTLDDVLAAADAPQLLQWLRHRPLAALHGGTLVLHAGVLPAWDAGQVLAAGARAQAALRGDGYVDWLRALGDPDVVTTATSSSWPGLHEARVLTYLRVLDAQGEPLTNFRGGLGRVPQGCTPWFSAPQRRSRTVPILCGHWAALGLHQGDNICALDTGCVWGGPLTAKRLDDGALISVPCRELAPKQADAHD